MDTPKQIGLKEIAYELGVSLNTVSRALRDCDDISESTKKKVREKAIAMGYFPNSVSEFVKKGYKRNIAFVVPNFLNSYFPIMYSEILQRLDTTNEYNFNAVLAPHDFLTEEDIKRFILQRQDAIIAFIEPTAEAKDIA